MTIRQLIKKPRILRRYKDKRPALQGCPQKKARCLRIFIMTPRKPNSAKRKVARIVVYSLNRRAFAFIPGIGHNLQKHSKVLIRGGRVRDLPGMKYRLIRGVEDLAGLKNRRQRRSKYGTKKEKNL